MFSSFETVCNTPEKIVIRDIGHDDGYMSVTNDIDRIVKHLYSQGVLRSKRLFYYDSEGELVEALHKAGEFLEYVPGDFFK